MPRFPPRAYRAGLAMEQARAILRSQESEDSAQRTVAAWLDAHRILWCHVPNGGARSKATAGKLKAAGVKAGVPDILIFSPPLRIPGVLVGVRDHRRPLHVVQNEHPHTRQPYAHGVALELKRGSGGRVSPEQREWLAALEARGWVAIVAHGSHDAIAALEALGYGR